MKLSQVGLSIHMGKSTSWIRKQGELVTWRGETWARVEYSSGRLYAYELVTRTPGTTSSSGCHCQRLTPINDMKKLEVDLVSLAAGPMLTDAQRRALVPPCGKGPRGHVAPPGTGPEGETCGSCAHLFRNVMAKTYLKCDLNRGKWTGGGKTDVRARDHACRMWAGRALTGA